MSGKNVLLSVLVAAFMFFLPHFASGHSLWINATDHAPVFFHKFGAKTKIYVGYGHRYPVDDFLPADNIHEYFFVSPNGKKTAITPVSPSGFLESEVKFREPGSYAVALSTRPGFYTMFTESDAVRHKLGPKTGLKSVILSTYYEQYAKSLIIVGSAKNNDFKKAVGHRMEIVPLENPMGLKGDGGHTMPLKVLFNGQPARFCKVYATYSGFSTNDDFAYATTADQGGIARIRLSHWGPWLMKANLRMAAPEDMKDKCNELNYTATLTLDIP